jgi:BASS family bile acid:Na+ symporter
MSTLIQFAVPAITFALLFTVGCDLRPGDFRRLLGRPAIVGAGLFAPLVILPILAAGLIALFGPSPSIASGLLIVSACPIGGFSNFYSHLAMASPALSVTLTGLSCLLAVVTIPALSAVYRATLDPSLGLSVPILPLVVQIFAMLVLPVSLGMAARRHRPQWVDRHRRMLQHVSLVALALLLTLVVLSDVDRFVAELPSTVPLAFVFVAASFAAGWGVGLLVRADGRDCFTLASEFATRNVAVATMIAVALLHRVEFATFATTYVLTEAPIVLVAAFLFRNRASAGASAAAWETP